MESRDGCCRDALGEKAVAVGVELGELNCDEVGDKVEVDAERTRFERSEEMNAAWDKARCQ